MSRLSGLLRENMFKPEDVPAFERKLFFEAARRRPYLERFAVLLLLATIIATVGVINDSTATVIGAMIIAPLMLPIMATAAALVMGQKTRAYQSGLLVMVGIIGVIGVSWLMTVLYPDVVSFMSNSQITSRTSPRFLDLIAALASGAAGAFAMSRDDVADSLPGVAIAISLVPPLCVVGVSLAHGEIDPAIGAFLLFATNVLAILLAGGGVLAFLGLSQAATTTLTGNARRNAFLVIILGVLIIAVPLSLTGIRVNREIQTQLITQEVVSEWLSESEFELRGVQLVGRTNSILISGPGESPPVDQLITELENALPPRMSIELEIVPSQKHVNSSSPGS